MRDQSGCRAAFGAPPASSVPAGGGPGLPLKGPCGCVEGSRSPTGPPCVVAVGSLSQRLSSTRMKLGMQVELSPGGRRHRAGSGTECLECGLLGLPSFLDPSFLPCPWPSPHRTLLFPEHLAFPGAQAAEFLQPAPPANSSCPKCLALYRTATLPLYKPAV